MPDLASPPDMATAPLGANFVGNWTGTIITSAYSCANGQTFPASSASGTLPIVLDSPGRISWQATCGATFVFDVAVPNYATQSGTATCPPSTANGQTDTFSYKNGTLSVNGNALTLDAPSTDSISTSTGTMTTCTATLSGTLAKH